jgi:hypothetical protein
MGVEQSGHLTRLWLWATLRGRLGSTGIDEPACEQPLDRSPFTARVMEGEPRRRKSG